MSKTITASPAGSGRPAGENEAGRPVRYLYPIQTVDGVAWCIATRLGSQEVEADRILADYGSQGPLITRAEVIGWMKCRLSRWPQPEEDNEIFQFLIDACNLVRVTAPAQDALPSDSRDRMSRVKKALDVLGADLPGMMRAFTQNVPRYAKTGETPPAGYEPYLALAHIVDLLPTARLAFNATKKVPKHSDWHLVVVTLAWRLHMYLLDAHERGITNDAPDLSLGERSPTVRFIAHALPRVGCGTPSTEAIEKALRQRPRKKSK